jgi:hypothetical protein
MSVPRPQSTRVISIGGNLNLLSLRHAILELAGYEVWSTTNFSLAKRFIQHKRCGVLLLHYSIPGNWRNTLVEIFRNLCPDGRVVGIVNRMSAEVPVDVDEIVFDTDRAEALLKAVGRRGNRTRAA